MNILYLVVCLYGNLLRQTVRKDKLQAKKNKQDLTRTVRTYKTCSAARFYFLLKTQFRLTESREKYGISAEKWTGPLLAKWINNEYGPLSNKLKTDNFYINCREKNTTKNTLIMPSKNQ
jgi:hypothetical protein